MITMILPCWHHSLAHAILDQLQEGASFPHRILVIDNSCTFKRPDDGHAVQPNIINVGKNLGYLRANNLGLDYGLRRHQDTDLFICMNDDLKLSRDFLSNLWCAWKNSGLDFFQPAYDDEYHPHLTPCQVCDAESYLPMDVEKDVPYIDGTVMCIPKATVESVGLFDAGHFGDTSWGDAYDYSIRCRHAGLRVGVTHRAYVNHYNHHSYRLDGVEDEYVAKGHRELQRGMHAKYGHQWRKILNDRAHIPA